MVKSFKDWLEEDGGMGAGAVGGGSGAAPTTVTAGVAGAGSDNKTIPVSRKKQREYQLRGMRQANFGPGFK